MAMEAEQTRAAELDRPDPVGVSIDVSFVTRRV